MWILLCELFWTSISPSRSLGYTGSAFSLTRDGVLCGNFIVLGVPHCFRNVWLELYLWWVPVIFSREMMVTNWDSCRSWWNGKFWIVDGFELQTHSNNWIYTGNVLLWFIQYLSTAQHPSTPSSCKLSAQSQDAMLSKQSWAASLRFSLPFDISPVNQLGGMIHVTLIITLPTVTYK